MINDLPSTIALKAARAMAEVHAETYWPGGELKRLAMVQTIIAEAIREYVDIMEKGKK